MAAPVPLYALPDWRDAPGTELASVPGETDAEVASQIGLAFDADSAAWVSPRANALKTRSISVADLDDEELARGQVRDSDGKFRSGPHRKIPREFHDELMRRILETGTAKLRANYMNAIEVMVDLMNDKDTDDGLRAKLAQYVIERMAGKTPDVVVATIAVKPWETIMNTIIREVPHTVIEDAMIIGDDDDD